jgi:hypothetical protein
MLEKDGDQVNRSCENEEVLYTVKEERNILHRVQYMKANWMGLSLQWNGIIEQSIERKTKDSGKYRCDGKTRKKM